MRGWMWAWAAVLLSVPSMGTGDVGDLYDEDAIQALLGRPVGGIEIDPPMEETEDPLGFFGVEAGTPLTHDLVKAIIEKLWLAGKAAEVNVLGSALEDGTVLLTVKYELRMRIEDVVIKGNKKLSKKKIVELIGYRPDMELFPGTLETIEATLHKEYALRGFPDASFLVETRQKDVPDEVDLVITVIEGSAYLIHDVRVEYEGEDPLAGPVPLVELANAFGLDDGDIYSQIEIEEGMDAVERKLVAAGHLNAEAGPAEPMTDGSGRLTLLVPVRPGPLIRFVIVGNDHIPDGEALAVMDPEHILPLSAGAVEEMAGRLADHLRVLGFLDARVVAHQKRVANGDLVVYRFSVSEGPRVKVEKIRFEGNTRFSGKVLRKQVLSFLYEQVPYDVVFGGVTFEAVDDLLLAAGKGNAPPHPAKTKSLALWPPEWIYWKEAYDDAIEHIAKMYVSEGYLDVRISPPAIKRKDESLVVTIVIEEGTRTLVESVEYAGNEEVSDQELSDITGLSPGSPFSGLGVKEAEEAILDHYADRGYRFASVDLAVAFSPDGQSASVSYGIVEGPEVIVKKIVVRGTGSSTKALIMDRIGIEVGDTFTLSREKRAVSRLLKLGIFRSVTVTMLEPGVPEPGKTIVIEVVEAKPQYLALAGGASTAEGVRGSIEYGYRNLFGYAVDFHFRVALNYRLFFVGVTPEFRDWYLSMPLIDQLERNVGVGLTLPHLPKIGNWLTLEASFAHLRKNSSIYGITTNSVGGSVLLGTAKRWSLTLRSGVESSFIEANKEITEDLLSLPVCNPPVVVGSGCLSPADLRALRVPQTDNPAAFVVTTGNLSLDFRDNPFNPTRGLSFNASLSWIISPRLVDYTWYEPILYDGEKIPQGPYRTNRYWRDVHHEKAMSNLLKISSDLTGYISLGTPRVVVMLHAGGGIIVPMPGHTHTFPDRLFYLGGARSLRGVPEEGLCAQDEFRDKGQCFLGGELMVMYKAELRVMLHGNLGLAFFVDAGNLWHGWSGRYETRGLDDWYDVFIDLRVTSGLGVRYVTPVGPLNFDVGFLINRHEQMDEPIGQFHFSIGTF